MQIFERNTLGSLTVLTSALAITTFVAGAASAQTVIQYGPWLPPSYVLNDAVFFPWAEQVEEVTEGRVTVEVLPSAVGSAAAQVDVVHDGAADMVVFIAGYTPGRFDALQLGEMPLLSSDVAELSPAFYRTYEEHFADLDLFGGDQLITIFSTTPTFIAADQPVETIDDLSGLKLRAPSALSISIIDALGGVPTQQPVSEMYELISSGIVDGTLFAYQPILGWNLQDLITNVTTTRGGMGQSVMGVLINAATWDSISAEDQEAIMAISGEAMARAAGEAYAAAELESYQQLVDAGVTIIEASDELEAAIQERLRPIEEAWFERAAAQGLEDPEAVLEDLRDDLAAN